MVTEPNYPGDQRLLDPVVVRNQLTNLDTPSGPVSEKTFDPVTLEEKIFRAGDTPVGLLLPLRILRSSTRPPSSQSPYTIYEDL